MVVTFQKKIIKYGASSIIIIPKTYIKDNVLPLNTLLKISIEKIPEDET